ncbi:MAG: MtrB/PioB family decaheme-associated outer membrane protein [Gammaproteobacteria bacterium]|nr:MtrB/PioB family decaheme-associated outer membrane protein [Gammaproteobacteria bacterium]
MDIKTTQHILQSPLRVWLTRLAQLSAVSASSLLLASGVIAADVDFSDWACEACPFDSGYRATYSAGAGYVSDDSAKFGNDYGEDEQGAVALATGDGIYTTDNHRMVWALEDLGLDSRSGQLEGGNPGTYGYYLEYRETPHYRFNTTSTIFRAAGSDQLTEPAGWTDSGLTSGFTALSGSLRPQNIATERQAVTLGGNYRSQSSPFKFTADYRHEERDGNRIIGGSYFTQAALLPVSMDYQTDDVDIGLSYTGDNGQIRLGYHAGWFRNNNWSVTWDNPFTAPAAAARGRLAQEPDNQYQRVSASGSYRLERYNTVLALSTQLGKIDQHDSLLPYTTNPGLARALPRARLDGSVDTTHWSLSVVTRPVPRARVRFNWTHDERDNQTPRDQWQRVIVDSFDSGALETNIPFSYERTKLNLRTTWDLIDNFKVAAGFERTETDRDFQEVAEQTEKDSWAQLQWRPRPLWQFRIKGGTAKREIDRYDLTTPVALAQNPLLRKYNLAYRFREYGSFNATADLPNMPITLSASVRVSNDNYTQSVLGLLSSDEVSYSADLDWRISDKTTLYLNGGWDDIEAEQTGSQSFARPDWRARHDDEFFTGSAGIAIRGLATDMDLFMDYTHTDGDSTITTVSATGALSPFPDLQTNLDSFRLRLVYHKSDRLSASLQLRFEDFSSTDWALDQVGPATLPTVLTLGADPYNYNVYVVGVQFTYSLGATSISLP